MPRLRSPWVGLGGLLAVGILLAYPAAALYPYHWALPVVRNSAVVTPGESIRFERPGIAVSPAPPAWTSAAMRESRLTISLIVRPLLREQFGPGRIASLSMDPWNRNFTVGQEGSDLIFRLRTPATDLNGMPEVLLPGVFGSLDWVELEIEIERDHLVIRTDGVTRLQRDLPPQPLAVWDPLYRLMFGNERTGDRPWLGEIRSAQLGVGSDVTDYVAPGSLETAGVVRYFHNPPRLIPFGNVKLTDAILNLLGFIPLGVLLGTWQFLRGAEPSWRPVLLIAALSGVLEILQLGIPERYFSLSDLILNSLGGAIGLLFIQRALRAAPTSRDFG